MVYEWLKFPQVAEIFDAARNLAKDDGRECVSEWYVMLSLLRFDSVWTRFNNHDVLKKELFHSAQREPDCKVNTDALFEEAVFKSKQAGLIKTGDTVVITAGVPLGIAGKTDMIHVVEVV